MQALVSDYAQFGSQYVVPAASYDPVIVSADQIPGPTSSDVNAAQLDSSSQAGGQPDPVVDWYTPPIVTAEGAVYPGVGPTTAQRDTALAAAVAATPGSSSSKPTRFGISVSPSVPADYQPTPAQAAYQAQALATWELHNQGIWPGETNNPYFPGVAPVNGSNPTPIANGDQPLGDINTLLDAFHNTFASPAAAVVGPSPAPGVTVIPNQDSSSSSGASGLTIGIWLGVIGIVITIALHFWSEHKAKKR